MENKKIIICTTFRDFKGNDNDNIQRLFLESLEKQTHQNFELVVTLFGEKNVETEVKKNAICSFFYESKIPGSYRYSQTAIIKNAIKHCEAIASDYILLWTTCDVIYDKDFLLEVNRNCHQNTLGTSHPHITYNNIQDFELSNKPSIKNISSGFDLLYFDSNLLKNKDVSNAIDKYVNVDWGIFEMFLISLSQLSKDAILVNIFNESKVYKIENNRELTDESKLFLSNSFKHNLKIFEEFLHENNITRKFLILSYCHVKFSLSKNSLLHYLWNLKSIAYMIFSIVLFNNYYKKITK
jgi:hypothetical protein